MFVRLNFSEKSPSRQLAILLSTWLFSFTLFYLIGGAIAQTTGSDQTRSFGALAGLLSLSQLVIFALPALFWGYYFTDKPITENLSLTRLSIRDYAWVTVGLVFFLPAVYWLGDLNHALIWSDFFNADLRAAWIEQEKHAADTLKTLFRFSSASDFAIALFVSSILPAFCEELFFRATLQNIMLRITKKPWLSICITAFVFSVLHMQMIGFFPRLLMGIFLGYVFFSFGNVLAAILAHALFNSIQVVYLYIVGVQSLDNQFKPEISSMPTALGLTSFCLCIGAMIAHSRKFPLPKC